MAKIWNPPGSGRRRAVGAVCLACFLALGDAAFASPGSLDSGFGSGGTVTITIGASSDVANAAAIQTNGKIVVAGQTTSSTDDDFALARLNTNGSLDTGFGSGGVVTTNIAHDDDAYGVAIQSDQKIVAAGSGGSFYFGLARYNINGSLDGTFGTGGKVTTLVAPFGSTARAVAVQGDQKIVAAGYAYDSSYEIALARYNTNGTLDGTFGTGGLVTTDVGSGTDKAYALAIQTNGKIVVGGWSNNGADDDFVLARYNTNGTLDGTFGSGGIVTTAISAGDDHIHALAIQPDGKIIAAGWAYNPTPNDSNDFVLARYDTNGTLDGTFGTGGIVRTSVTTGADQIDGIGLQSDGRIVAAGQTTTGTVSQSVVARYNTDGSLDPTFGGTACGMTLTPMSALGSWANAVVIQGDDKAVVTGAAQGAAGPTFAVTRYDGGVAPFSYQPDAQIKISKGGVYLGNNIYNKTGSKQTVATRAKRGTKKTFLIAVNNDGNSADTISLHATGAKAGFSVRYLAGASGTTNITSQVKGGSYSVSANSCPPKVIREVVTIKKTAIVGARLSTLITATSQGSSSAVDAVRTQIRAS